MKKLIMLLLIITTSACAGPRVLRYPRWTVVETTHGDIMRACCTAKESDQGVPITAEGIRACYKSNPPEIWVEPGDYAALLHELCHAEGLPIRDCDRYGGE